VIRLGKQSPSLRALRSISREGPPLELDPAALAKVRAALSTVQDIVASGKPAYGINTGFGRLSQTRIPAEELEQLQLNIVLSHAAGTGPLLDDATVRLIIALKVISLGAGHSGVRPELIELLLQLYNRAIYPCIPSKGSVGASGDLAPLAHLSLALLGIGEVRLHGVQMPAATALAKENLEPIKLAPKEGLALLNGTQVSTALALTGLFAAEDVFAAALVAGSLSVDAAAGSDTPFDARIHALRGQPGQQEVARCYAELLQGSAIRRSHLENDPRVQDPYSLRCQPQVMGACLDQMRYAAGVFEREAAAVTDNPLVFPGEILSGGNFDSLPTSANQEDHVSMATFAARRLTDMAANSAGIVAIELLAAAQGIDFRAPLKTSLQLQKAHRLVRSRVAFYAHDRYFAPDITAIQSLIESGEFHRYVPGLLLSH
jgi:histidine ammonia-lyase